MNLKWKFYFRRFCWFGWWWGLIRLGLGVFFDNSSSYCFWKDCLFNRCIWGQFGFDAGPLTLYLKTAVIVRTDQISALFNPVLSLCCWPTTNGSGEEGSMCSHLCQLPVRNSTIHLAPAARQLCLLTAVAPTVLTSCLGSDEVFYRNANQIFPIQLSGWLLRPFSI